MTFGSIRSAAGRAASAVALCALLILISGRSAEVRATALRQQPIARSGARPFSVADSSGKRPFLVCIDPGHPSETSAGAHANGLSENSLNWEVAERLARRLHTLGIALLMTKQSENEFVTNRRRAEMANDAGASLFIRIHCDVGSGRGYTWYYPNRAATKDGVTGPPAAIQRASREAAHVLNDAMKPILRGWLRSNRVKTDAATFVGRKQGGALTGSIFSRVPTALIEMCFINRRADARFIASPAGQEKMAKALARAIEAYRNFWDRRAGA